jgi:hypothetical protein
MKQLNNQKRFLGTQKQSYTRPLIEKIKLDNEISMVMMSDPPIEGLPTQDPLISIKKFRIF